MDGIVGRAVFQANIAISQVIETDNAALATIGDQFNFLFLTRLKTDCGCSRDIQMLAKGKVAIKFQVPVDLEEMEMAAHLNGTIACIVYHHLNCAAVGIIGDVAIRQDDAAHRAVCFWRKARSFWIFNLWLPLKNTLRCGVALCIFLV